MTTRVTELGDIQALVKSGFGSLDAARYLLLSVTNASAAKAWLGRLQPTTMADIDGKRVQSVLQVALSAPGFRALGLADACLAGFSSEFQQGMAGHVNRSTRLGDTGTSAPAQWLWGQAGFEPHVLIILLAGEASIDALAARVHAGLSGVRVIAEHASAGFGDREPFGFRDGLSQPEVDWEGAIDPGGSADQSYRHNLAPGEVLLGYRDEYGLVADSPRLAGFDFGRNGSYLVFRRLRQDVRGFWRWLEAAAGADGALALAEAMVGRRIDGMPLPGLGDGGPRLNDFHYLADPEGHACPMGAHVRRANPRTGDLPGGRRSAVGAFLEMLGLKGTAAADAIASTRFHRFLRRGRAFGSWLSREDAVKPDATDPQSGLNFLCLGSNIARQFEFVQGAWLVSSKFAGLSGEADPLIGTRDPLPSGGATDAFKRPQAGGAPVCHQGLPRFVTVEAGGYFFLPGIAALRRLAET